MAAVAELVIRMVTDTAKARGDIDATASRVSRFGSTMRKAAAPAGAALLAVGAAAVKMGNAAAEDQQQQALLANAMKQTTGASSSQIAATEEWIAKTTEASLVADDKLRPALATLMRATKDTEEAQSSLTQALDISAATGKDVEQVSAAIAKAYSGNTSALTRLVPGISKAAVESKNMDRIMGELAETTGGSAAAAADTSAGKMQLMAVQMDEMQESLGAALIPAMGVFAGLMSDVAGVVSENATLFQVIAGIIAVVATAVLVINAALMVYNATMVVVGVVSKAAWLSALGPIGLVIIAVGLVVAAIVILWKKSETFRSIVLGVWSAIKAGAAAVAGFLKGAFQVAFNLVSAYVRAYLTVVMFVFNAIRTAVTAVAGFVVSTFESVKGGVSAVWSAIAGFVSSAIDKVMGILRAVPGKITGVFSGAATLLSDIGRSIIEGLGAGIDAAKQWLMDKVNAIADSIPGWLKKRLGIGSPSKVTKDIGEDIMAGISAGMTAGLAGVEAVTDMVAEKITRLMEKRFKNDKRAAIGSRAAIKAMGKETQALKVNARAREAIYKDLAAAQDELDKRIDARRQYFESVRDATRSFGAVTNLADKEATTAEQILADMRERVADAGTFAALIQQLTAQGLNPQAIADLTAAGVDGGLAVAQGLAEGGPAAVAELNALQAQLDATAAALGTSTADTMHAAGIASAQALVDGLVLDAAALETAAETLANALAAALESAIAKAMRRARRASVGGGGGGGSRAALAPVVPLHAGVGAAVAPRVPSGASSAISGGGTGPTIIVNGALDPEAVARQIRRILGGHSRRQGLAS